MGTIIVSRGWRHFVRSSAAIGLWLPRSDRDLGPVRRWCSGPRRPALTAILLPCGPNVTYESRLQVRARGHNGRRTVPFAPWRMPSDAIVGSRRPGGEHCRTGTPAEHLLATGGWRRSGCRCARSFPSGFAPRMRRACVGCWRQPRHVIGRVVEVEARRKDGSQFPVELSSRRVDGRRAAVLRGDDPRHHRTQACPNIAIAKQRDLYAMLSGTNQRSCVVRGMDELFHEVCRVAVGGHFRAASIGLIGSRTITCISFRASAKGAGDQSISTFSIEAADASGRGPVGERSCVPGQYGRATRFSTILLPEPWHDAARATRVRAVAAFRCG